MFFTTPLTHTPVIPHPPDHNMAQFIVTAHQLDVLIRWALSSNDLSTLLLKTNNGEKFLTKEGPSKSAKMAARVIPKEDLAPDYVRGVPLEQGEAANPSLNKRIVPSILLRGVHPQPQGVYAQEQAGNIDQGGVKVNLRGAGDLRKLQLPLISPHIEEQHLDFIPQDSLVPDISSLLSQLPEQAPHASKHKLCIIVAFRHGCGLNNQGFGRNENLKEFLTTMDIHLAHANPTSPIDHVYIISEQSQKGLFNKGALFDAGFVYGSVVHACDYFVFHDVDQVPTNLENTYAFPFASPEDKPIHMCVSSSQFKHGKAYESMVGGALMMAYHHVLTVNGYSMSMFGWGKEDDEMYVRLKLRFGRIRRLPFTVGTYTALDHKRVMDLDVTDAFLHSNKVHAQASQKDSLGEYHFMQDGVRQVHKRVVFTQLHAHPRPNIFKVTMDVLDDEGNQFEPC